MDKYNQSSKKINKIKNRKGQAVIELALVLPLICVLLCGTIEFGWLCFNQLSISDIARQGAREGVIYSAGAANLSGLTARLIEEAPDQMRDKITIHINYSNQLNPREGDVIAHVTYTAEAITPILGIFTSSNQYQLNSTCTMKVE